MNVLGLFAKHWTPGAAKTRLTAELSIEQAAAVHREMVAALLRRFGNTADRRVVVYAPPAQQHAFAQLAGERWELEPQIGGDLGARMRAFFVHAFLEGALRVVVIGSDSPSLPIARVQRALELLADHEVVIGPSEDGGYYLLGASWQAANDEGSGDRGQGPVNTRQAIEDSSDKRNAFGGPDIPVRRISNPKSKIQNRQHCCTSLPT